MATEKKQSLWGVIVLTGILSAMFYWTYREMSNNYAQVEGSSRMVQSLLENQTQVVRSYASQISSFKQSLQQTEDLLAQAQAENADLKGKLAMLENVAALELKISQLEQANEAIKQEMQLAAATSKQREDELHAKLEEVLAEQNFKNPAEGRAVMAKYRNKIREIKAKIRDFQIKDRNEEIALKKAQDAARTQMGNNGFLVRNGQNAPVMVAWPPAAPKKNVQIDVTFVK